MRISDRYHCQEHDQDIHDDCLACEFYRDIKLLEDQKDSLTQELSEAYDRIEYLERQQQ